MILTIQGIFFLYLLTTSTGLSSQFEESTFAGLLVGPCVSAIIQRKFRCNYLNRPEYILLIFNPLHLLCTQGKAWLHGNMMSLRCLVSCATVESKMADESEEVEQNIETTLSDGGEGMEAEG